MAGQIHSESVLGSICKFPWTVVLSRIIEKVKVDRTHDSACLHLAEVVILPGPPVFVVRRGWALADPFFMRLAEL